ncbi:CsbD-like [Gemella morbillorum]|uniref:CsbD family protein n=1 Tax=Gemella morbillorum TaxID=29391 RepID=UPI000DA331C7|nr:CsbD family protein [Gemella morbillorum]UBH80962.1 CsbD family protein [Gemella morbillorum]SQH54717.1 CsbD-like [Gemella morbillorum]
MSIEEKLDQAKGSVKEGVGKLTGDEKLEKEGTAEKVTSKVKEVIVDAKDAVEGAIKGVKNVVKKDEE